MGVEEVYTFKENVCKCGSTQYKMIDFIKTGICTGIPIFECIKCGELATYGDD